MTNKEKLQILLDREERAYELLRKLEPTDPAFGTCLDNSHRCMYVRSEIVMADVDESLCGEGVGPAPEADQEPEPETEVEQPKPEAKEEAAAPATNDAPQLTRVEVRDRLSAVSIKHGSDVVTRAMAELGFVKLSQIPAERYGELLDKVEEAVRCRQ